MRAEQPFCPILPQVRLTDFAILSAVAFSVLLGCATSQSPVENRKHTVTFDSSGGTSVNAEQVNDGSTPSEPPVPTSASYTFYGWFTGMHGSGAPLADVVVNSDTTVYADWVLMDVDGNMYDTVVIGGQTWMKQNLKTTHYNDSTVIMAPDTGTYCWYNDDSTTYSDYGLLYDYDAVGTGKLAPKGWHVPSDSEWNELISFLGAGAASKLMETGTAHWGPQNAATNSTGFTALPGGQDYAPGMAFGSISTDGYWWSTTSCSYYNDQHDACWITEDSLGNASISASVCTLNYRSCSVRCIRN